MFRTIIKTQRFLKLNNFGRNLCVRHASLLVTSEKDGIRELVLNDPKQRNTLSMEMMDELLAGLTFQSDDKSVRCIVISSTGDVFSSGHNIKELAAETDYQCHKEVFAKARELMKAIRTGPVPVIAKVDGLAAAGGCQLVASCDIVVSSDRSSFSTPTANFGIFCSTPGIALARTMPRNKALYMLFVGRPISAQEAYTAGLVSVVVPQGKLDDEVQKICDAIKSKSRDVIQLGKEFYHKQITMEVEEAYRCGETIMADNLALPDGQEGIRSFIEKRKPTWKE